MSFKNNINITELKRINKEKSLPPNASGKFYVEEKKSMSRQPSISNPEISKFIIIETH